MKIKMILFVLSGVMAFMALFFGTKTQASEMIGNITAVQREVNVIRPGKLDVELVTLGGSVLFKDFYETKQEAKLKLLFDDDSILTLGENTQLEITENIYDPKENRRSTVFSMVNGSVRALVGKIFGGPGSKFEIHTPTAAAAARGTYFIVWKPEKGKGPTGVVNIGEKGLVEVNNIEPTVEGSVMLQKNQYTMVEEGQAPTPAARIDLKLLGSLLLKTEVKDKVVKEVPKGMEAPGSDVSMETLSPIPGQIPGIEQASLEGEVFTETTITDGGEFPTIPPLPQQPEMGPGAGGGETPVTVTVDFP